MKAAAMKSKFAAGVAVLFLGLQAHAQGVGRITPPQEKLGTYLTDTGAGLDTGCTYRGGGPLVIQVPVPPVVNPDEIGPDGHLKNPNKLIANKVMGATATIMFPAYDVDDKTPPAAGTVSEQDKVSFNGKAVGMLAGFNEKWRMQQFTVPISELKFSHSVGTDINNNELRIDIDTGNAKSGIEAWCTSVDWVEVKLDVAAPYVLAHGIAADASTWDEADSPGVISYLNDLGVAWNRFTVPKNGSVAANAGSLGSQISNRLKTMKSDRVHIIAHSKGGLDSQAMAANSQDFKILSLSTLSTPNYGSLVADITSIMIEANLKKIGLEAGYPDPNKYVEKLINRTQVAYTFNKAPLPPGLWDLKTDSAMPAIMRMQRGNIWPTFSIGADADLDNNGKISNSEGAGMIYWVFGDQMNAAYQVLRRYSSVSARLVPLALYPTYGQKLTLSMVNTSADQPNDIVVTEASANPSWATALGNVKANHTTMKTGDNIRKFINQTITLGRE